MVIINRVLTRWNGHLVSVNEKRGGNSQRADMVSVKGEEGK